MTYYADPDCQICSGWGVYCVSDNPEDENFDRWATCECAARFRARAHWERIMERFDQFSSMTPRQRGQTFDDLNPYESTLSEAIKKVKELAAHKGGGIVTLWGSSGSGKTHIARAFVNAALAKRTLAMFVTAEMMLEYLRAGFDGGDSAERLGALLHSAKVLAIDDLTRINPTAWGIQKVFDIINQRYEAALDETHKTLFTLNFEPNTIRWDDGAIASRLYQFPVIHVEQGDAREALKRGFG